jgi:ribosomal protein S21
MQVSVRDNNVEQALRALKKKLQREGVFRETVGQESARAGRSRAPCAQARPEEASARRRSLGVSDTGEAIPNRSTPAPTVGGFSLPA